MLCNLCNKYTDKLIACSSCTLKFCSTTCMFSHFFSSHQTPQKPSLLSPNPFKMLLSPQKISRKSSLITEGKITKPINKSITKEQFSSYSNFESSSLLGSGSYGDVYLSKCESDNKFYAVKCLLKAKIISKLGNLNSIYREIELHSKLSHPNIIKLFSYYESNEHIYLIMEYAKKGTLFHYIRSKQYLLEKEAFFFFIQVCNAIYFLHENKLIHRDIKPENLLICDGNTIKLCDFGLCYENSIGNRNTFCGTFEYMAPEILNENSYNNSVDIWSLGILLYEMLYGFTPFKKGSNLGTRIVSFNNGSTNKVSFETKDLIRQMLMSNPRKRITIKEIFNHKAVQRYEEEFTFNSTSSPIKERNSYHMNTEPTNRDSITQRASLFVEKCLVETKEYKNEMEKYKQKQNELKSKLTTLRQTLGLDSKKENITSSEKKPSIASTKNELSKRELIDAIKLVESAKKITQEQNTYRDKGPVNEENHIETKKPFKMFSCDEFVDRETIIK